MKIKFVRGRNLLFIGFLILSLGLSCSKEKNPVEDIKLEQLVRVDNSNLILKVGEQAVLKADFDGVVPKRIYKWTSSNPDVATVQGNVNWQESIVKAIGEGVATIRIFSEDGEVSASCDVKVTAKQIEEPEPDQIDVTKFANLIKANTSLVSSIEKNETEILGNGLSYTEIKYQNSANKPMVIHALFVELDKGVSFAATAASNGVSLTAKETIRKQLTYVENRGHTVLAALNGDFWRVSTTETDATPMSQAYGALYINGEMIKDITRTASQYYFTALLKDGSFTMGDKTQYAAVKSNIKESIGGRYLLVKDGVNISDGISNKDIHPRTSIGQFDKDKVVFIVVDGRVTSSQGLSMQDLGKIFHAIGVKTAINLDGGGSATLLTRDSNNALIFRNKQGEAERAVTNGWTIIEK